MAIFPQLVSGCQIYPSQPRGFSLQAV